MDSAPIDAQHPSKLRADCGHCTGLCCVALALDRSGGFAVAKPAGRPCLHLRQDFGCRIHGDLAQRGWPGCVAFDCLGAGQRVTRTFAPRTWRDDWSIAEEVFAAFAVTRALHELLWYLADARSRREAAALADEVEATYRRVDDIADASASAPADADVAAIRDDVAPLLLQVSEAVRAAHRPCASAGRRRIRPGADLAGARLASADLRGADLRGAVLIAADVRAARLAGADLIGADLRDADLTGADVREALYLTPAQVASARTDSTTRLPAALAERLGG